MRPLLSIIFPKGFQISKDIGHPTSGSGGKKTVKKDQKPKKTEKSEEKNFFLRRFETIFKQKFSYLRPLLSITFPQGFRISKNIGHPTLRSGGKQTVKKDRKPKKTEKSEEKKTLFCAAILGNFQTKMFLSETTFFHYFSPRIPNL